MNQKNNNIAVSETIGIVLLVAITVILAALIANLAFSFTGNNLQKPKSVAVTIATWDEDIAITYLGGTDDPRLTYISVTAPNGTVFYTVSPEGDLSDTTTGAVSPDVGAVMLLRNAATGNSDHVIVVGQFDDGSTFVLLDTFL